MLSGIAADFLKRDVRAHCAKTGFFEPSGNCRLRCGRKILRIPHRHSRCRQQHADLRGDPLCTVCGSPTFVRHNFMKKRSLLLKHQAADIFDCIFHTFVAELRPAIPASAARWTVCRHSRLHRALP